MRHQWLGAIAAVATLIGCSLTTNLDGFATGPGAPDGSSDGSSSGKSNGTEAGASGSSSTSGSAGGIQTDSGGGGSSSGASSSGGSSSGGSSSGDPPARVALVQSAALYKGSQTSVIVPLNATTKAGSTIVVAVGFDSKNSVNVTSITDDAGNTYVSAGYRAADTNCTESADIWYAKNVNAGALHVTVNNSSTGVSTETWVMEFSGLDPTNPLAAGAVVNNQPASTVAHAPLVAAAEGGVVVSTAIVCDDVSGLTPDSPFTDLAIENTEFTAYYIAKSAGSYGASWNMTNGTWCATSVAFH